MKFYHFRKHKTPDGYELDPDEIFTVLKENTADFENYFTFISNYIEMSNWYNTRTSPMNGDEHTHDYVVGLVVLKLQ